MEKPVVLVIVDGFGIADAGSGNAITQANTPNWDNFISTYPWVPTEASGIHVGLPEGVMGNSEVGHLTIGTGRVTFQSLERINQSFAASEIGNIQEFKMIVEHVSKTKGSVHLMGLVSDGKVHSDLDHLLQLITLLHNEVASIFVHAFTDGRDTPTDSGVDYIEQLINHCNNYENVKLATVIGRYYAMDRDTKWERTKIAYDALVSRMGEETNDVLATIKTRYSLNETDEFLKPIIVDTSGSITDGDSVFFFNFRPDRARQITKAIIYDVDFETIKFSNLFYASMTRYDEGWDFPVLFNNPKIKDSIAEVISNEGLKQIHIAETEKYAHVTYFLNGGEEAPFPNEDRVLVPSPRVDTYDLQPEMSTPQIVDNVEKAMLTKHYSFIVVNIACPDMVGHTGIIPAAITAVEEMDKAFGMIFNKCTEVGYTLFITSDHGNAEKMLEGDDVHTAHTSNQVPFLICDTDVQMKVPAGLKNIAPTILDFMGLPIPSTMNGGSLLK